MRRHNRDLFRIARAVVGSRTEAEDVLQDSYVRAYSHLESFEGRAALRTWLVRIVINQARMRLRKRHRDDALVDPRSPTLTFPRGVAALAPEQPEQKAARREIRSLLEREIDALPEAHRTVFVLRDVEGQSTQETATQLEISAVNVRIRLHRARTILRANIRAQLGSVTPQLYDFGGEHCDALVQAVLLRVVGQPQS